MPRQSKNNRELFDINNIDKAAKLIQSISDILSKTHSPADEWMKDGDKLEKLYKQLNELSKQQLSLTEKDLNANREALKNEMKKLTNSIKLSKQQLEADVQRNYLIEQRTEQLKEQERIEKNQTKLKSQQNRLQEEANRLAEQQANKIGKQAKEEYNKLSFLEKRRVGSESEFVSSRRVAYKTAFKSNIESAYSEAMQTGGAFNSSTIKSINSSTVNELNDTFEDFNEGSGNLKIASKALSIAGDTITKGAKVLFGMFTDGINNQSNIYESTFSSISARSGMSRDQYFNAQHNTASQLWAEGLYDNVAVSDVQTMWDSLSKTGMSQETIIATAMDNVITNKIVPYLDTTTTEFNLLNTRLDGNFVKQIRGINQANLDMVGNNYTTSKVLQTLLDKVTPMSDLALQDLAKGSAELSAFSNYLTSDEVGMTEDQANQYITQIYKMQRYSDQIVSNGSVYEKVALNDIQRRGINYYDMNQLNDTGASLVATNQWFARNTPGYTSVSNGLQTNTIGSAVGLDFDAMNSGLKANEKGLTFESILNKTNLSYDEWKEKQNKSENNLKDGKMQTETEKQRITIENMATDVAILREKVGTNIWSIGETLLKGIWDTLKIWVSGKVLGNLLGVGEGAASAGGSSGLLGALGTGAAVVGLTAAAMTGLAAAYNAAREGSFNSNSEIVKDELAGTNFENDSAMISGKTIGMTDSEEERGIWGNIGAFLGNAGQGTWLGLSKIFNSGDFIGNNKKYFDVITTRGDFAKDDADNLLYAYAFLLNEIHSLKSLDKYGVTEQSLINYIKNEKPDEVAYTKALVSQMLQSGTYVPSGKNGEKPTDVDWGRYENSHRQGLARVPYDDYPAILHEDEAVLTASTANELRNLITEYRDTQQQSANFEAIIQDQTAALVAELREINQSIKYISTTPSLTRQVSNVWDNMTHIRSTKSFT